MTVPFAKIGEIDGWEAMAAQIDANPQLWNEDRSRTAAPDSPHREADDIWLRWLPEGGKPGGRLAFYPAWHLLPALHAPVWSLMAHVRAVEMGGLLITRIPAGAQIHPHSDKGGWHADLMNRKFYVVLRSPEGCLNYAEGAEVHMRPGEVWEFDNHVMHGVLNRGVTERVSLIVSLRTE